MSAATLALFDKILGMNTVETQKLVWALNLGNVSMLDAPYTKKRLDAAKALPYSEVLDPYDCKSVLSDTILNRAMSRPGSLIFSDAGTDEKQLIITAIGGVYLHASHNVTFNHIENRIALTRFTAKYNATHPAACQLINAKMSMLPDVAPHGVYAKYRPKRTHPTLTNDKGAPKMYERIGVSIIKHGAYDDVPFQMPEIDLLALAMFGVMGPLPLYSVMWRQPSGREALKQFSGKASQQLPKVDSKEIANFYYFYNQLASKPVPSKDYPLPCVSEDYYKKMVTAFIGGQVPVLAKDKGIYNTARVLFNPFGATTLTIGHALYECEPTFAAYSWISIVALDAAKALNLNVITTDGYSAPCRDGVPRSVGGYPVNLSRPFNSTNEAVSYPSHEDTKGNPLKYDGECYIDLSYDTKIYQISSQKQVDRQITQHKHTTIDRFGHDYEGMRHTFAKLLRGKADALTPRYKLFVVVVPVSYLTAKRFLGSIHCCYELRMLPGTLACVNSVIIVGKARGKAVKPMTTPASKAFCSLAQTLLARRLYLYASQYKGYISEPYEVSEAAHTVLNSSAYVNKLIKMEDSDAFVGMFVAKKKNTNIVQVAYGTPDAISHAGLTADTEFPNAEDDDGSKNEIF
jgi:hypothetical protein